MREIKVTLESVIDGQPQQTIIRRVVVDDLITLVWDLPPADAASALPGSDVFVVGPRALLIAADKLLQLYPNDQGLAPLSINPNGFALFFDCTFDSGHPQLRNALGEGGDNVRAEGFIGGS